MAVTSNTHIVGGSGQAGPYSYSFAILADADVRVSVNGIVKSVTTHYTLDSSNTRITFVSGQEPSTGDKVIVYRDTDEDPINSTFVSGSTIRSNELNDNFNQLLYIAQESDNQSLSTLGGVMEGNLGLGLKNNLYFEGDTDNAYETTLTVVDPTADRTITLPNVTGTVVTTGDTATVTATMMAANSVDTSELVDGAVTDAKIAANTITAGSIAANAVTASELATGAVINSKLATDSVDGAKIAANAIDSDHYVDGSIDLAHLANNSVNSSKIVDGSIVADDIANTTITGAKLVNNTVTATQIAANAITASELADDAVDTNAIANNAVVLAKMAANSVDSDQYVDGSIDNAHLANNSVNGAKIATDAVTGAELAANAVDSEHYVDGSIDTAHYAAGSVTNAKIDTGTITGDRLVNDTLTATQIANNAITSAELAADAVNGSHIADNSIDSEHYVDGSIDSVHIADNAVTTAKIADAELTTLAGMQSGTASKLADSTALTADIADLNQIDGLAKQTTITNDDAKFPTSGAVVDYVAAQIAPLGGLEVIADEDNFPTQPASGVVISISNCDGIVVNSSGVCTTARTAGNGSDNVTINNFPASLRSKTLTGELGLMVSSTGSSNTYNYHKLLAKEADVEQLSQDINDFGNRYRVGGSNPSSNNDDGDLFFNTGTGKMLVYNANNTAWEEVQSIGNFYINTIASYSGTGGNSATFNGSAYRFVLSNAPTNAQQLIVSINGVVQKPNAGTSQPSEGFAIDGSSILFGSAPASGSDYFIITCGSTVNIGTPSDNTISTAKIQNLAVTADKIANTTITAAKIANGTITGTQLDNNTVTSGKIAANTITASQIADDTISEVKLDIHNAPSGTDKYLKYTSNGMEWVTVPAGVGGALGVDFNDGVYSRWGDSNELQLHHNANGHSYFQLESGKLFISANGGSDGVLITEKSTGEYMVWAKPAGGVNLYYDGSKKFETTSAGVTVSGILATTSHIDLPDNCELLVGNSDDLRIYHSGGTSNIISSAAGHTLGIHAATTWFRNAANSETTAKFIENGAVELYHNNVKCVETDANGIWLKDDKRITFGDSNDGDLRFKSSSNQLELTVGNAQNFQLNLGGEVGAKAICNGAVQLYHNNVKTFETDGNGIFAYGPEGGNANVYLYADEGDDNADKWSIEALAGGSTLTINNRLSGSFEKNIECNGNGNVELYYDNSKKFETTSAGTSVSGNLGVGITTPTTAYDKSIQVHSPNTGAVLKLTDSNSGSGSSDGFDIISHNNIAYLFQRESASLQFATNATVRAEFDSSGHFIPNSNNAYDLGSSSKRWRNFYVNDAHFSNEGSQNSVDGTWGDWTLQEGEDDIFMLNNRTGKKYKMALTEVS